MKAPDTTQTDASTNLNYLRRGTTYRVTTRHSAVIGEFMGMETPHGDRAVLLRHTTGTDSIALSDLTSILAIAA